MTFGAAAGRQFESDKRPKHGLYRDLLRRWGGSDPAKFCSREKKAAKTSLFRRFPSLRLRFSQGSGRKRPKTRDNFQCACRD
jgi:hypothetical protein